MAASDPPTSRRKTAICHFVTCLVRISNLLLIEGAGHLDFSGHATAAENRVFGKPRDRNATYAAHQAASTIFWEHHLNTYTESPFPQRRQSHRCRWIRGDRFEVSAAGTPPDDRGRGAIPVDPGVIW